MKRIWQTVVHGPWPYWVGAVVLAILNVLVLIVRRRPWGITTNLEEWAGWASSLTGLYDTQITIKQLLYSTGTYLNLGVILGSIWAALAASQFRWRPIRHKKYLISALIGGIMVGFGARIAYGCNIGGLLNGIASNSLTGWIFAAAVFLGTWIGAKLLLKFLM